MILIEKMEENKVLLLTAVTVIVIVIVIEKMEENKSVKRRF